MRIFERIVRVVSTYRYSILVSFLFLKLLVFTTNGLWSGDFWEHSAVITSLIENPFHPKHPFFLLNAPHSFTSPYSLLLATFAKVFSLTSIETLSIFGLINFLLFSYGLKRFSLIVPNVSIENIAFYLLLLTLLLWGTNAWPFSGFFHLEIIGLVLPYPSTFAIALSFIGLNIYVNQHGRHDLITTPILGFILWIVLLSHPLTFIFLISGLFFLSFTFSSKPILILVKLFSIIVLVVVISFLWPYFSISELLLGGSSIYHISNAVMYHNIWERIWPNLLVIPFVIFAIKSGSVKIIALWLLSLTLIYAYGKFTHMYSYGRVIAFCIFLFHLIAAVGLASFESYIGKICNLTRLFYQAFLIILLCVLSLTWLPSTSTRLLTIFNQIRKHQPFTNQVTYKNLIFINSFVQHDQLVLSDSNTSLMLPTFGGKVIAVPHPQAFIIDFPDRQKDVDAFFSGTSNSNLRLNIIDKYQPEFLLLDSNLPSSLVIETELSDRIELLYKNNQYRLFKIH